MSNPPPPAATYPAMGSRAGYSDGNPLTTAILNAMGANLVAQDGNGNVQQLVCVRLGPNCFLTADPFGFVWLSANAYYDTGTSAWYPIDYAVASYAIEISQFDIQFWYAPSVGGAGALTWQGIGTLSNTSNLGTIFSTLAAQQSEITAAFVAIASETNRAVGVEGQQNSEIAEIDTQLVATGAQLASVQGEVSALLASLANVSTLIFASTAAAQASGTLANGAYYYVAPSAYATGALDLYKKNSGSSSTFVATLPGLNTFDALFGGKGDGVVLTDATIASGALGTVTSASNAFATAKSGGVQAIIINSAGPGGANLNTTIATVVNAGEITLTIAASGPASAVGGVFGTDNASAMLAAQAYGLALAEGAQPATMNIDLTPGCLDLSSNPYALAGINLDVDMNGASMMSIASGGGDNFITWWFGGIGYVDSVTTTRTTAGFAINDTPYAIETVNVGSNSISCIWNSQASNFVVGQPLLITSLVAVEGGSPPGMRRFDYALCTSTNTSTGVVGIDRETQFQHLSTLPTHFTSGNGFTSAAQAMPLGSKFYVRQKWRNGSFLSPANASSGAAYAIAQGWSVDIDGCSVYGGITPSQLYSGTFAHGDWLAAGNSAVEFDKLVRTFKLSDSRIAPTLALNSPLGNVAEFDNCDLAGGIVRSFADIALKNCTCEGAVDLRQCRRAIVESSRAPTVYLFANTSSSQLDLTVDGATVTWTASTTSTPDIITIPNASSFSGAAIFLGSVAPGDVLEVIANVASNYVSTGGVFVVDTITDDLNNQYLNGNLFSFYATSIAIHTGAAGTGYAVNDTGATANGLTYKVTAESGGVPSSVEFTQNCASYQAFSAVLTAPTTGYGSGLELDIGYGLPASAILKAAPRMDYFGRGNPGGEQGTFVANDQSTSGGLTFFPNGGADVVRGNYRYQLFTPQIGQQLYYQNLHCAGVVDQLDAWVIRAYTGSQFSGLKLRMFEFAPVYDRVQPLAIALGVAGKRTLTATNTYGAQSGDMLTAPGNEFIGAYNVQADTGGAPVTFSSTDTQAQLPIVLLRFKLIDQLSPLG